MIRTLRGESRRRFEREAVPQLDLLYRVALHLTRDPMQADDLVQDTMLRAYRGWRHFRPGSNVRAWLLTVLRNTFINEYRRRRRTPESVDIDAVVPTELLAGDERDPEGIFFRRLVGREVVAALDALPEHYRETVLLSDVEGLNYHEVGRALGLPIGTVKSRLSRARRLLQQQLRNYAAEMGYLAASDHRGDPQDRQGGTDGLDRGP